MIIDYTSSLKEYYKGKSIEVIAAHGKGKDFLMLTRVLKRGAVKTYRYDLVYRQLSYECLSPNDKAYTYEEYEEIYHYTAKELSKEIRKGPKNLFICFTIS